ncbi:MAG: SRPBCC domain-containing protein [Candidatus Pacebacteria bacterium]|nr:SRPBCC domain-containing protein [Candidatus Paceibacterota bacterium]
MEKITFTTIINAPREKVWNTMLKKDTYQEWTVPFHEGSTYDGNWEEGSEMKFMGPSEDGSVSGMYAVIATNRLHEFISIKHLGEFKNDEKTPWPDVEGQEGYENYTFKDVDGGTEVLVELTVPAEWKSMFEDMWPKALAKLKEIAENSTK